MSIARLARSIVGMDGGRPPKEQNVDRSKNDAVTSTPLAASRTPRTSRRRPVSLYGSFGMTQESGVEQENRNTPSATPIAGFGTSRTSPRRPVSLYGSVGQTPEQNIEQDRDIDGNTPSTPPAARSRTLRTSRRPMSFHSSFGRIQEQSIDGTAQNDESNNDNLPSTTPATGLRTPRTLRRRPISITGGVQFSQEQEIERDNDTNNNQSTVAVAALRSTRMTRRPTSYYSSFQTICLPSTDVPPPYAVASRQPTGNLQQMNDSGPLPGYTCTVAAEGKLQLSLESISPLGELAENDWRDIYVVLRGTLLTLYRGKDRAPSKILRSYTLQHAEIGLAVDTTHTVLAPRTRLAHLIPSAARKKAWQKDPDLFKVVRYTILRLRVETDQILLSDESEGCIFDWVHKISSAIDISHSIDERSIPRQCTVPRRRRRRAQPPVSGDLADPALVAEQARIMREMYPSFAERPTGHRPELVRSATATTNAIPANDAVTEAAQPTIIEEEELDLNMMREDFTSSPEPTEPSPSTNFHSRARPAMSRHTTTSSMASVNVDGMIYATNPANFSDTGKWQPAHPRTTAQVQRYIRRCMPILNADAVRASDVLISEGKRVKINWRMDVMEEWDLKPPSYRSHHFDPEESTTMLGRSRSQNSHAESAATATGSRSTTDQDHIEPVEHATSNPLELNRISSLSSADKEVGSLMMATTTMETSRENKRPLVHIGGLDMQGAVCCF